ncbi:MAG TPA: hypothetical protein VF909_12020, partial [Roseiflexaceae bacterium]
MSENHPNWRPARIPGQRGHRFMRGRGGLAFFTFVAVLVLMLTSFAGASAGPSAQPQGPPQDIQGEHRRQDDRDNRKGVRAPDSRQRSLAAQKGAHVRWNNFGTPAVLRADSGFIDTVLPGDEVAAARAWVLQNRELFHLSEQGVADLELIYSAPIGKGRAVLFRQRFGNLPTGHDGLLSMAVVDGKLAYVSSSIAGDGNAPGPATVSAKDAVATAAADAGRAITSSQVSPGVTAGDTQQFLVKGFSHPAYVRLVAVPTPLQGVRPAWEITLIDNTAEPLAFTSYVDAQTNDVL